MPAHNPFEYDVAVSFATDDRAVAEELAGLLAARKMKVLRAEYQPVELGGSDFLTYIAEMYRTKAQYCLLLISKHYPLNAWTEAERASAREHALRDPDEYILPLRLDDSEIPGIKDVKGYQDLQQGSMESVVDLLEGKVRENKLRSGPPSQSHDLRSGNVPPAET
jgi:hypothetical protein